MTNYSESFQEKLALNNLSVTEFYWYRYANMASSSFFLNEIRKTHKCLLEVFLSLEIEKNTIRLYSITFTIFIVQSKIRRGSNCNGSALLGWS